jgi:hypothetical protein
MNNGARLPRQRLFGLRLCKHVTDFPPKMQKILRQISTGDPAKMSERLGDNSLEDWML